MSISFEMLHCHILLAELPVGVLLKTGVVVSEIKMKHEVYTRLNYLT